MSDKDDDEISAEFLNAAAMLFKELDVESGRFVTSDNMDLIFSALVFGVVQTKNIAESLMIYGRHLSHCPLGAGNLGQECVCGFDFRKESVNNSVSEILSIISDRNNFIDLGGTFLVGEKNQQKK